MICVHVCVFVQMCASASVCGNRCVFDGVYTNSIHMYGCV